MYKVKQSSKNITPFGGLNLIYTAIKEKGVPAFLDKEMGERHFRAKYSYSDIILSLLGNSLSQGERISDLEVFKKKFSHQCFDKIPSPDTIEYACQELKTRTIIKTVISDEKKPPIVHQFNYDSKKNALLVALCVKTGQLKAGNQGYTLDFDNVVVENEKQDAKKSYKKTKGYHPSFSFIGRLAVHIENRNGNTPAKYMQKEALQRCFDNLDSNKIAIEHFRADCASYQKEVVDLVAKRGKNFYIRIIDSPTFRAQCAKEKKWEQVMINYEKKEVASICFAPFDKKSEYRAVVTRTLRESGQADLFSGDAYNYYGIMTSNDAFSNKEVIEFYNQRGDAENSNRYLLNDFNLHHLPFMDMDSNTVFMYLEAICSILFEWVKIILVKNKASGIKLQMRAKAVCFHYVTVTAQFVNHARQKILQVFSNKHYVVLQI